MRILITGAAGFLGSHLSDRYINEGHHVVGMDNLITGNMDNIAHLIGHERFEFIKHDVSNYIYVAGPIDAVLHFASPASPNDYLEYPIPTLKVGSLGTHNTLGLALAKQARYLLASTSEVYGDPQVHPQPESYNGNVSTIGPRACYDEGKRCAETLFFDYWRQYRIPIKVARIFNTYGPRMLPDDGRVVSNFIVQALKGESLTVYGHGAQTRSFCYVDDLVDGLVKLMATDDDTTGPLNLGNPAEISMLQLAQLIISMVESNSEIGFHALPEDDPVQRQPDITLAKETIDWQPQEELRAGLKKTIEFFRGDC